MAFQLEKSDLEALLLGGCFFGSGGGGTITSARNLASHFIAGPYYPSAVVHVVDVEEATEGDAVMVAYMGAPVAINNARYPEGPVKAVQQIQAHLARQGRKLAYVVPPESGALGFVVAALVAARLGLAVVDADGAGRAVPSLPMLTFAAAELVPRPAVLVSQSGLAVELDVTPRDPDNTSANGASNNHLNGSKGHQEDVSVIIEQMMRPIVSNPEFAEFGGLAMWIMTPETLAPALPIRRTLTRALEVGRLLQKRAFESAAALIAHLAEKYSLPAFAVFDSGRITSVQEDTAGGFDVGKVRIEAGQRACTVLYQNESLLAWADDSGSPIGMAPDSLAYFVEGQGQQVFSNGDLLLVDGSLNPAVKGRTATLIGISAAPPLVVPDGLILTSFMALIAQLGYLGPYIPLRNTNTGAVR